MVKKSKVSYRERRIKKKQERTDTVKKQRTAYSKRKRNKQIFNYTIVGLIVIAIIAAFYTVGTDDGVGEKDDFARCLTQAGLTMYGTDWCPHCQDQKRMFGKSFKYVNYVNCDINSEACDLAGIEGYPTWVFPSGDSASGVQELSLLGERSGCTDGS